MLTNLKEILKIAEDRKCAIGSCNTPNLESMRVVLAAAEELNEPVIPMHAQVHEEMGLANLEEIGKIMLYMADKAKVPVCVHLNHGTDVEYVERALKVGYTAVMYDSSTYPLERNYADTCRTVELATKYGVFVEAAVGSMGSREGGCRSITARPTSGSTQNPPSQSAWTAMSIRWSPAV